MRSHLVGGPSADRQARSIHRWFATQAARGRNLLAASAIGASLLFGSPSLVRAADPVPSAYSTETDVKTILVRTASHVREDEPRRPSLFTLSKSGRSLIARFDPKPRWVEYTVKKTITDERGVSRVVTRIQKEDVNKAVFPLAGALKIAGLSRAPADTRIDRFDQPDQLPVFVFVMPGAKGFLLLSNAYKEAGSRSINAVLHFYPTQDRLRSDFRVESLGGDGFICRNGDDVQLILSDGTRLGRHQCPAGDSSLSVARVQVGTSSLLALGVSARDAQWFALTSNGPVELGQRVPADSCHSGDRVFVSDQRFSVIDSLGHRSIFRIDSHIWDPSGAPVKVVPIQMGHESGYRIGDSLAGMALVLPQRGLMLPQAEYLAHDRKDQPLFIGGTQRQVVFLDPNHDLHVRYQAPDTARIRKASLIYVDLQDSAPDEVLDVELTQPDTIAGRAVRPGRGRGVRFGSAPYISERVWAWEDGRATPALGRPILRVDSVMSVWSDSEQAFFVRKTAGSPLEVYFCSDPGTFGQVQGARILRFNLDSARFGGLYAIEVEGSKPTGERMRNWFWPASCLFTTALGEFAGVSDYDQALLFVRKDSLMLLRSDWSIIQYPLPGADPMGAQAGAKWEASMHPDLANRGLRVWISATGGSIPFSLSFNCQGYPYPEWTWRGKRTRGFGAGESPPPFYYLFSH